MCIRSATYIAMTDHAPHRFNQMQRSYRSFNTKLGIKLTSPSGTPAASPREVLRRAGRRSNVRVLNLLDDNKHRRSLLHHSETYHA